MAENNLKFLRVLETIVIIGTSIGLLFAAFEYMESRHAKSIVEFELKHEILDRDIKKDNETRLYYQNKKDLEGLTPAEQSRLRYLEEELEHKYDEQRLIKEKLMEMKDGN